MYLKIASFSKLPKVVYVFVYVLPQNGNTFNSPSNTIDKAIPVIIIIVQCSKAKLKRSEEIDCNGSGVTFF